MKRSGFAGLCGLAACLTALPAFAQEQYYEYNDWRLSVTTVDTGEDLRTTCRASTGGDGDPVLSLEISNGDAGPPDFHPDIVLNNSVPRGYANGLKDGARVGFLTENGQGFDGTVQAWFDEDGISQASAAIDQGQTLWALQAMADGGVFEIASGEDFFWTASFFGFRDAYAHMMEACGFTSADVIVEDTTVQAPPEYYQYRDWTVTISDNSYVEHDILDCAASTGMTESDPAPAVTVWTEMRDGEPPYGMPSLNFRTTLAPGQHPDLTEADLQRIYVGFDDGSGALLEARSELVDGYTDVYAELFDGSKALPLLQAMRRNRSIYLVVGQKLMFEGSLLGFTAAYGKIAEQCRFSADNVIR